MPIDTARGDKKQSRGVSTTTTAQSRPVRVEQSTLAAVAPTIPITEERHHGGGLFALVAAAMCETGGHLKLAKALLAAAHRSAFGEVSAIPEDSDGSLEDEEEPAYDWLHSSDEGVIESGASPDGRDSLGRFTPEFNTLIRSGMKPGDRDPRLDSDSVKRQRRSVDTFRLLQHSPSIVAYKLLAMGATPLLNDARGFDGLASSQGEWLRILGGTAYMPATLDKTLAEMAELEVAADLWTAYASWSIELMHGWAQRGDGSWQQKVFFVDATQDPYWTQQYALSAKVSRLNKVMPCLSRVAISAGAGPPILVETVAGSISLKTNLIPTLERLERITGESVGRFLVIDNEMCTLKILAALMAVRPRRYFVTVLKGPLAESADIEVVGTVQSYRERDRLEEGKVLLVGPDAPAGLDLRTVIMSRSDSRHPTDTIFLTDAPMDEIDTVSVADLYLSRWPQQEQFFRDGRNGGGLNHSHGYGGEYVTNVALETALEKCERQVLNAEARVNEAEQYCLALRAEEHKKSDRTFAKTVKLADQAKAAAEKSLEDALELRDNKRSTPKLIFRRDVTRDSIATAAKLLVLMLVEFVMREYFQGTRAMYRTLIVHFMFLPVTVLAYHDRIVYRIESTIRGPDATEALHRACDEINRRQLSQNGRLMVYEVVDPLDRKA
jgi:hypothetical protein